MFYTDHVFDSILLLAMLIDALLLQINQHEGTFQKIIRYCLFCRFNILMIQGHVIDTLTVELELWRFYPHVYVCIQLHSTYRYLHLSLSRSLCYTPYICTYILYVRLYTKIDSQRGREERRNLHPAPRTSCVLCQGHVINNSHCCLLQYTRTATTHAHLYTPNTLCDLTNYMLHSSEPELIIKQ